MTARTALVALTATTALAAGSLATAQAAGPAFKIHASVKMLPGGGTILKQRGTFSGAPLGRGTVDVATRLGARKGTRVTFTFTNRRGSVRGIGYAKVKFKGTVITYSGTAQVRGLSGDFAHLRRNGLRFTGTGDMAGETFAVDLAG
jgi:hypothetical protein